MYRCIDGPAASSQQPGDHRGTTGGPQGATGGPQGDHRETTGGPQGNHKVAQDGPKDASKVAPETAKVGGFQKQAFRFDETHIVKIPTPIDPRLSKGKVRVE